MENFINQAQQFMQGQSGGGGGGNNQGGNYQGGNNQGGGGGGGGGFDFGSIASLVGHANDNDQNGSGNTQMFSQAASFLKSNENNMNGDVDENQLMQNHEKVNNSNEQVDSNEIGNASALSAIKNVLGGSSGNSGSNEGFQQKLIGAAMAHAGQMFDQKDSAGTASGTKQDAMQSAGQTVMQLMIKHQVSSMIGGGGSGGLSSLMKLAM